MELIQSVGSSFERHAIYSDVAEFGAITLIYDIANRLGITEIIDGILPKRKQGASVGSYILTASINRATALSSKSGLAACRNSIPILAFHLLPASSRRYSHLRIFGTIPVFPQKMWIVYLTNLFDRLPNMDTTNSAAIEALMPWNIKLTK